ncbi:MAG: TPM domain-containing protein [Lachnospiraceae bacterium]|nr:TPM domain-containing protein [Lachnospiraceae bacterium]
MRKRLLCLLVLLTMVICTGCGKKKKPDSPGDVIIHDYAGLLSDDEESKLREQMEGLTGYGSVIFITVNQKSTSTAKYAANMYDKLLDRESGILFVIDMGKREIYIETDGYIGSIITRGKARVITDNTYKLATRQYYYLCASNTFEQAGDLLAGMDIPQPMMYASNAIIAVIAGLLINFIVLRALNRKKEVGVKELGDSVRGRTHLVSNGVEVLSRNVTVIHTSSGGGGGRGGFGGGGGHHSHGGGHRF